MTEKVKKEKAYWNYKIRLRIVIGFFFNNNFLNKGMLSNALAQVRNPAPGRRFCQEKKGLEIYGWRIMPSHVHMIIGSSKNKLEDIVRDMKKHTSLQLEAAIKNNVSESRKEWIIWIACPDSEAFSGMERAGKKNGNN